MSPSVVWEHELQSWLEPFLTHLHHPARRRMCPLYVAGLMGPGERKSRACCKVLAFTAR